MLAKMTLAARAMMMPSACTALYSLI
jgi:hypothetical protein